MYRRKEDQGMQKVRVGQTEREVEKDFDAYILPFDELVSCQKGCRNTDGFEFQLMNSLFSASHLLPSSRYWIPAHQTSMEFFPSLPSVVFLLFLPVEKKSEDDDDGPADSRLSAGQEDETS